MARPPVSDELKQAQEELARAQARVNELQAQEWEKSGGMGCGRWWVFGAPFYFVGQGLGSLVSYFWQQAQSPHYYVRFPTQSVLLMLVGGMSWLAYLWVYSRRPALKEELRRFPVIRRTMIQAAWIGLFLGLLFSLFIGFGLRVLI